MRIVIQRVKRASVSVDGQIIGNIGKGIVVLLGVSKADSEKDADYLVNKLIGLRIFEDENYKMNLSAEDVGAQFLVISQFTIYGNCQKGRRPSFDDAGEPKQAQTLYEYFVKKLKENNFNVETGRFAAMMDVDFVNYGPVTFILDSM